MNAVAPPWWTGVPPLEAVVPCGPGRHRLRWSAGRLETPDHPDPAGEAVLADLGGDQPLCLGVREGWAAHAADPAVLVVGSRHPGDTLAVDFEATAAARAAAGATDDGGGRLGLLELLALAPGLGRRLQLEVAVALTQRSLDPTLDPAVRASAAAVVEAAAVGRLTPTVRRWADEPVVAVSVTDDPAATGATRTPRGVSVTVDRRWLTEVWGRYLGAVEGFLVLAVHRVVEDRAEVTALGAPGGDPARLVLRGPAPWRVEGRRDPA